MSDPLYLKDAYRTQAEGCVTAHSDQGGVILDASLFYATSGGQPGDSGFLSWEGGHADIATTVKGAGSDLVLVPVEGAPLPAVGTQVMQNINWEARLAHMRVHTALHLLSVVIPLPVTGGSISIEKGRLDFNMPDALENKEALQDQLNALIAQDLPVTESWISEDELDANPSLVKTLRVAPPRGTGVIRLVRIGEGDTQVDLQPCGGTHVKRTGEIGRVRLGKTEKKGRENRRVYLHLTT